MTKRISTLLVALLVLSLSISTSANLSDQVSPTQTGVIKIGSLGPLAIPVGVDMENAAEMAVNEINADGGITITSGTYDLELVSRTTSGSDGLPSTTTASQNLNQLIDSDGVNAILGGFRTEVVLAAIQPIVNATQVPFLGVGSTAPLITEYFYRVGPVNGTTLARNLIALYGTHLLPTLGITNVTIVHEDAAWAEAIAGAAIGALNNPPFNMRISTSTVAIDQGASGSSIASSLDPLNDDDDLQSIMTLFSAPVGQAVSEQWAAVGLNQNVHLAGINVASQASEFFVNTGGAAAGEITLESAPPGVEPTTKTQTFREAYVTEFSEEPTYTSFAAYDAVYIIKEAIEAADDFTPADIHSVLPDTDYVGVATRYKFTSELSAGQVASPAVPEAFKQYNESIVHDLYTTSTVGVPGFPYSQPYFAQWLEDGTKVAIWAGSASGYDAVISPPFEAEEIDDTDTSTDEGLLSFVGWFIPLSLIPLIVKRNKKLRR